ncbi:hypothetical protein ACHWQZ_G011455 [Mnemiopsis leidyi]
MLRFVVLWTCLNVGAAVRTTYSLEVLVYNQDNAGCDHCKIYGKVISQRNKLGQTQTASLGLLDKPQHNEFRRDGLDYFSIRADDVGIIECLELTSHSKDGIRIQEVVISSTSHPQPTHLYNTAGKWISTKSQDVRTIRLCSQGVEVYHITTKVTTRKSDSGTDSIHMTATIEGEESSTKTGLFNRSKLDDFRKGAEDTFIFRNLQGVHGVKCINLKVGGKDKLILDWIKVESSTQRTVVFHNTKLTALSADGKEGVSSLRLCN